MLATHSVNATITNRNRLVYCCTHSHSHAIEMCSVPIYWWCFFLSVDFLFLHFVGQFTESTFGRMASNRNPILHARSGWWLMDIWIYAAHFFRTKYFALSKQSACRLWNQWIKLMRRRHNSKNSNWMLDMLFERTIAIASTDFVWGFCVTRGCCEPILWAPGSCDQSTDALHTFFRCINYTNLNRKKGTVERMVSITQLPLPLVYRHTISTSLPSPSPHKFILMNSIWECKCNTI